MRTDDLKVIASLGDWTNADKLLNKLFYEKFGRILEQKLSLFQERKADMKECIKKNYSEKMMPRTPKRVKPMAALLEQIHEFKKICFDSEDADDSTQSLDTPAMELDADANRMDTETQIEELVEIKNIKVTEPFNPFVFNAPDKEKAVTIHVDSASVVTKMVTRSSKNVPKPQVPKPNNPYLFNAANVGEAVNTPFNLIPVVDKRVAKPKRVPKIEISKTPVKKIVKQTKEAVLASPKVLRHSVRQAKIKTIEARANQALKHKEDLLKEKADRNKREREEHRQRVEENNRIKEAERQEREQQAREHEKRAQEFRLVQEMEELQKSPYRGAPAQIVIPRTPPRYKAVQPTNTPRRLIVPPKRSRKAADSEQETERREQELQKREKERLEQVRREQKRREEEIREQQRREQEHKEKERREKELLEKEQREQKRLEQERRERREQELLEQQNREKERLEQEHREQKRREEEIRKQQRREKERLEKELLEKEQHERDEKFRAAVNYEMTPDKIFLPSSKDNYSVDDLSSHDETDNEDKPRKVVPKWAQKGALSRDVAGLRKLVPDEGRERLFGRMKEPKLREFFKDQQKLYPVRSSSAIWASPMFDPTPGEGRFMNYQLQSKSQQ